jgi:hypothetical protein
VTQSPIRLSGPEALAAVVPTVLGFQPSDGDGVLLTFTGKRLGFTARFTLTDVTDARAVGLARSVKRAVPDATHAVLVGYSASSDLPLNVAGALWRAGLNLAEVLRVHDGQVTCRNGCTHPLPEDPARAEAVAGGRVVHESRDALYRLVEHTGERLTDAETDVAGRLSEPGKGGRLIADLATTYGEDLMERRETYLRIARGIEPGDLRRDGALCMAAITSHLAGDLAIANVALDAVTPGHRLATLLRAAISAAIPPADMREVLASLS